MILSSYIKADKMKMELQNKFNLTENYPPLSFMLMILWTLIGFPFAGTITYGGKRSVIFLKKETEKLTTVIFHIFAKFQPNGPSWWSDVGPPDGQTEGRRDEQSEERALCGRASGGQQPSGHRLRRRCMRCEMAGAMACERVSRQVGERKGRLAGRRLNWKL